MTINYNSIASSVYIYDETIHYGMLYNRIKLYYTVLDVDGYSRRFTTSIAIDHVFSPPIIALRSKHKLLMVICWSLFRGKKRVFIFITYLL